METSSPSASSLSAYHQDVSSLDGLPVQQSLLLSESLKGLRSMRSQLYSAADYFELSYVNDNRKEIVVRTLKDYAVEAIVNTVDHLGSVSYKVNNLLNDEVDEVSVAEFEVSCIEQRLRMCQACIDLEGLSQQSLLIKPPKYHKHYILQDESTADSNRQPMPKYQGFHPPKENGKLQQHLTATRRRPSPMRNARPPSPSPSSSPSIREHSLPPSHSTCPPSPSPSPSPSIRENSLPPPHSTRSTSPLPQLEKISHKERRAASPLRASNPLTRARSVASRPTIPNSSKQYLLESQNSLPTSLHAEQNNHKVTERSQTKKRGFLKSLLTRNRSWTDESLYSYLDEY